MKVTFKTSVSSARPEESELDGFFKALADPASANAALVRSAREVGRDNPGYREIKLQMPAWYFNVIFDGGTDNDSAVGGTELLYVDFDNIGDPERFKQYIIGFSFVAAAWTSVSGIGVGVLVRIPVINSTFPIGKRRALDLDKKFLCAYRAVQDAVGIGIDWKSATVSRACFQSLDENPLRNAAPGELAVDFNRQISRPGNGTGLTDAVRPYHSPEPSGPTGALDLEDLAGVCDRFVFRKDLDPFTKAVEFSDYVYYPEGKRYLQVRFPDFVPTGSRSEMMFAPVSLLMLINRHKRFEEFVSFMRAVMASSFEQEWEDSELLAHLRQWHRAVHSGEFDPSPLIRRKRVLVTASGMAMEEKRDHGLRLMHGHLSEERMEAVRRACATLVNSGQEVSVKNVAGLTGMSRKTAGKYLRMVWAAGNRNTRSGATKRAANIARMKDTVKKIICDNLKAKRITQSEVAKVSGISRYTVCKHWSEIKAYIDQCIEGMIAEVKKQVSESGRGE